jgi:ATP-binding cassette subfamily B (MDR/TAP) protein 1
MSQEKETASQAKRVSNEEKSSAVAHEDGDTQPKEAKGGLGPYFVSCAQLHIHRGCLKSLMRQKRVFKYADRKSWALNIVAFISAIAAGVLLPLMNLVFGKFVTTATGFATGVTTPAQYRSEVNKYTYVNPRRCTSARISNHHRC